jgi:hypothetical protein
MRAIGLRRAGRPAAAALRLPGLRALSTAAPSSWVPLDERGHFPLQNLPYGVVSAGAGAPRACVRIGDHVRSLRMPLPARTAASRCC